MLEFRPKIKKCKKCGILYNSRMKYCPVCDCFDTEIVSRKVTNTYEQELSQKYGKSLQKI